MSMQLTADQLRQLADQLDKLQSITGDSLLVESFVSQEHRVMVRPLDGRLAVVGITSGAWSGSAPVTTCRCRAGSACRCADRAAGQRGGS